MFAHLLLLKIKADDFHNAFLASCLSGSLLSSFFLLVKGDKSLFSHGLLEPITDEEEEDTAMQEKCSRVVLALIFIHNILDNDLLL